MSAPPITSTAFDFQGLASLRNDAKAQDPAALKEAAKQFESLFTKMLLKSMREANASMGDSMFGSDQADFYQGMFDDQLAVHLSQGRGLGLADMLIRQLAQDPLTRAARDLSREGRGGDGTAPLPPSPLAGEGRGEGASGVSQNDIKGAGAAAPVLPAPQGPGPLSSSKHDFVRKMLPYAEQAGRELGVDPHALLAQAALETGWGKSMPCNAAGEYSFNLFGIKAGAQWSGAAVNVPTLEFEDGVAVRKVERFRSYESPADSFRDYAGLIRNNPRYEAALGTGANVAAFASALQAGGYATDPAYAQKIVAVARETRELTANQHKMDRDMPLFASRGGL